MNEDLPINGWFHICVWCGSVTQHDAILPRHLFNEPEKIKTRDGLPLQFNGFIVPTCPICEPEITKLLMYDTYDELTSVEKQRMEIVQEKMIRRMRLKRPNFVRYE